MRQEPSLQRCVEMTGRLVLSLLVGLAIAVASPRRTAAVETNPLDGRPLPQWYGDAKFGIMIHWGPFSVPGWAETIVNPEVAFGDRSDPSFVGNPGGFENFMLHNPYAEWYENSLAIEGSGTRAYHNETYGEDFPYTAFQPLWEAELTKWDPEPWAELFARAGGRYVVLVTKHHDGYLLWPSDVENPRRPGWNSERDVVGELTDAVRSHGLRMGLYYSGGIDWTFKAPPIRTIIDFITAPPPEREYGLYVEAHWRELIDRYRPSVLWNDITSPEATDEVALFTDYYESVPDGVVNDRWNPDASALHRDFTTPEFSVLTEIRADKWETVRGMGNAFGYNQNELPLHYGSPEKFIFMLIDVVSKNGNLLLNVGPMPDGTIPAPQVRILESMGAWLGTYGEAIYDTLPWVRFGTVTDEEIPVRFTRSADGATLYATLLGTPGGATVTIDGVPEPTAVRMAGSANPLVWQSAAGGVTIEMPENLPDLPAHSIAIELPQSCVGDCDMDGQVTIDELVMGVEIALGTRPFEACPQFDANDDGMVSVQELVLAIGHAQSDC